MSLIQEKIRQVQKAEGLSDNEFANLSHIPLATIRGDNLELSASQLVLLVNSPRFRKYTLWLLNDNYLDDLETQQDDNFLLDIRDFTSNYLKEDAKEQCLTLTKMYFEKHKEVYFLEDPL